MTLLDPDIWFTTARAASALGLTRETLENMKSAGVLLEREHWVSTGSHAPSVIRWKVEACRDTLTKDSDQSKSTPNSLNIMENQSAPKVNSEVLTEVERQNKEAIHQLVSSVIGTPEQQREALKKILLENLHSSKARKLIMKYCTEYVESQLKKQIESILLEQQELIRRTVKTELEKAKAELHSLAVTEQATKEKYRKKPSYHSLEEIRALVTHNIDAIQSYFKGREICARALFDHLETYTELRPGDRELLTNGNLRWNQQVGNAVRDTDWPDSPFRRSNRRGYYELEYWKSAP